METPTSEEEAPQKIRRYRHAKRGEREEWVRKYSQSGQSLADFCREAGLSESTLARWVRRSGESTAISAVRFSEVPQALVSAALGVSASPGPGLVVHLHCGRRLEVASGTEVRWVAALASALEGAC